MANVKTYSVKTDGNMKLSTNFVVKEFQCKDGTDQVLIDLDLVKLLQAIRDKLGATITINSGYRTASHNANVGGSSQSYHLFGRAADIVVTGKTPKEVAACAESVGALGILRYETFVHVDTRTEKYFAVYTNGVPTAVSTHGGSPSSGATSVISAIQSTLNARYNTGLVVDGLYGANTKKAMIKGLQIEFNKQYNAGLGVDGLWGPKTKDACPIIYENTSGNIQYIIKAGLYCIAGYKSLTVNNSYDTNTVSAVKDFQKAKNLGVDGRTGPDTFAALFG